MFTSGYNKVCVRVWVSCFWPWFKRWCGWRWRLRAEVTSAQTQWHCCDVLGAAAPAAAAGDSAQCDSVVEAYWGAWDILAWCWGNMENLDLRPPLWNHTRLQNSLSRCVSRTFRCLPSALVFLRVWRLELDDGPRARYHMLSSVGTWSPPDDVIPQWPTPLQGCGNQRRMCGRSYLFIYSFSFFLIFLFTSFWYKYHHHHYRCCFPRTCGQSEVWYVATTGEKHVAGSWQTSLTHIPSQTNHKFFVEALSNRRWWVWAWLHNLPILRQDHGKRMFSALWGFFCFS